ncbi:hypothetical protein ACFV4N_24845 [Actinosynnema sp. NPDC059797]
MLLLPAFEQHPERDGVVDGTDQGIIVAGTENQPQVEQFGGGFRAEVDLAEAATDPLCPTRE